MTTLTSWHARPLSGTSQRCLLGGRILSNTDGRIRPTQTGKKVSVTVILCEQLQEAGDTTEDKLVMNVAITVLFRFFPVMALGWSVHCY